MRMVLLNLNQFIAECRNMNIGLVLSRFLEDLSDSKYIIYISVECEIGEGRYLCYREEVGRCEANQDEVDSLIKKAKQRRIEISETLIDNDIKMSEGWFE